MSKLESLRADAAELYRLVELTERRKIKDLLTIEAKKVETEISVLKAAEEENIPCKRESVPINKQAYDVKLTTYAWDQTDTSVKVFISLQDVESLPRENILCSTTDKSFEVKVKELHGKNYILTIKNLYHPIKDGELIVKVKSGMIILTLKKQTNKHWVDLVHVEKKVRSPPKLEDTADPSAGIMNLMRQMYADGDDDMKRSIAKAWTESREKKMDMGF